MAKKDKPEVNTSAAPADTSAPATSESAGATAPKAAKQETQYKTVTMDDGKIVDFAGKRKMLKTSTIDEASGEIAVRLDFVNGEVRHFKVPSSLKNKCAAHGAEQKLGDEIAGLEDVEDCILAIDELLPRLEKGEWSQKKEANGLAGTSVLARALVEVSKKPMSEVREFLKTKSQAEKVALRQNAAIQPIVARLEAEKTKKVSTVDTGALLSQLTGAGAEAAATVAA